MTSTRFIKAEGHLHIMQGWLDGWRTGYKAETVPEFGIMVRDRDDFIACGFLRRMEGGYAMFDGLASNPTAPGAKRDKALDLVIEECTKHAKLLGISKIMAFSKDKNTILRSLRHGFVEQHTTCLAIDLVSLE